MLEAVPVGMLVIDAGGMITYASASVEQLTGYGQDDIVGTSMFDYLNETSVGAIVESAAYVFENPDTLMGPVLLGFNHADGEGRILEVTARNRYDHDLIQGLVVCVRDQTLQYRLNDSLTSHSASADRADVLGILCRALLGLPVRGRTGFVDPETGAAIVQVQLPDELFGPAPVGQRPRPWQEALAAGEGVFPESLDGYDVEFRTAAADAGLTTVWAYPVPGPSAQGGPRWSSCVVVGRIETGAATINERLNIQLVVRNAALVFERDYFVDQLSRLARTDALTGLANRAHLFRSRGGGVDPATGVIDPAIPQAALYVDLDGFKQVNDDLGHAAGDAVLLEVAERMRSVCRRQDELGRIGGDEFAVLLWDMTDPAEAVAVAERIVSTVAEPIVVPGGLNGPGDTTEVQVGASVGISLLGADNDRVTSLKELLHRADEALYEAKRAGRGRWRLAGVAPASPRSPSPH